MIGLLILCIDKPLRFVLRQTTRAFILHALNSGNNFFNLHL